MLKVAVGRAIAIADRWQRRNRLAAVTYAVLRKFSDDDANLLVVALAWYGFTAIYPLILVVVAIFGYVGASSLGSGVVGTLRQFPIIGAEFNPGPGGPNLHGSAIGLAVGIAGLLYGAQGVTQTAEQAMSRVWNVPATEQPGFLPSLGRSLGGLGTIGGAFLVNAGLASIATGHGHPWVLRIVLVAVLLIVNSAFYLAAWWILTAADVSLRQLVPGSVAGAASFTALITVGAGLVQHQLRNSSATYGTLGAVIGVVTFLLLLAKVSLYSAELNPVLARRLWPRALPTAPPTDADDRVLRDLAHEERRRPDEHIGVGFGGDAAHQAATDAAS